MTTAVSKATNQPGIVKKVYQAFFSPPRYEVKAADREILEWGNNYRIPFEDGELAVLQCHVNQHCVAILCLVHLQ